MFYSKCMSCAPSLPLPDGSIRARYFCGEVRPYNRGLLQKGMAPLPVVLQSSATVTVVATCLMFPLLVFPPAAGGGGWAAVHVGDPGHCRNCKLSSAERGPGTNSILCVCIVFEWCSVTKRRHQDIEDGIVIPILIV